MVGRGCPFAEHRRVTLRFSLTVTSVLVSEEISGGTDRRQTTIRSETGHWKEKREREWRKKWSEITSILSISISSRWSVGKWFHTIKHQVSHQMSLLFTHQQHQGNQLETSWELCLFGLKERERETDRKGKPWLISSLITTWLLLKRESGSRFDYLSNRLTHVSSSIWFLNIRDLKIPMLVIGMT